MRNKLLAGAMALALVGCSQKAAEDAAMTDSPAAESAAEEANKIGMKIITIGVGTEKGGTIPLRRNGVIESYKRDKDNQIVITKLNPESLKSIAKATNGNYVNGANTKEVLEFVKSTLDKIQKTYR